MVGGQGHHHISELGSYMRRAVYVHHCASFWSSHKSFSSAMPARDYHLTLWPRTSPDTNTPRRVGPFSGAILAALVYEIAFRPEFDGILRHRGPGVGLFPGMAGVEGEEKTGAAGDVLPANAVTGGIAEGGGFQAGGNRDAQDKYHPV